MTPTYWLAVVAAGSIVPTATAAQTHQHYAGMTMPMPQATASPTPKKKTVKRKAKRATDAQLVRLRAPSPAPTDMPPMDHAAMGHAMPAAQVPDAAMDHAAMGHQSGAPAANAMPMDHGAMNQAMPGTDQRTHTMPGMDHAAMGGMAMRMGMGGDDYQMGSGTARLPAAEGMMRGRMFHAGDWMLMAHGYAWGVATDQGGPRGGDMAFVESMAMVMADRDLGDAFHVQLRGMGSLEPAMGPRGYPNLFATGEIANGRPLVDRQHPHDLFMELSARVDYRTGNGGSVFVYAAPVGEPALGPSAFMHRGSARYQPLSPITHHWFDSTHITYGVVTTGYASPRFQIEASAFKGREPDEFRWGIETPRLDSWSVRGTWTPTANLAVQVSHGRLKEPEAQHPGEDEARTTASIQYALGGLTTTFAYALKNRMPGEALSAFLGEATWEIDAHHTVFGRVENVANDELFPDHDDPLHDTKFRVTKAEVGYAYRIPISGPFGVAVGGTVAAYAKPATLDAAYGRAPVSGTVFAKFVVGL